jgi:gamma-glutamylputrescine oxidase
VDAVRHVMDLVRRHGIACDLVPGSQLIVADETAVADQEREADAAAALDVPVAFVAREALPSVAAGYASGLRYGPAATLDPAELTEQLARIGERRGLSIFEGSRVRRIRRGLLSTVTTDDGELVADHVVVAVNAFGGAPGAPAGVVGLRVQAGVTEKLPHEAVGALAGLRTEPLIEHGELSPYYRLTTDGRLVVGGGAVERGSLGSTAPAPGTLRSAVRKLSPLLSGVDLESTWAGPIGMTRDGLPVVGRHPDDPGLYHLGGCNGHGLATVVHNGSLLARWIAAGDDSAPEVLPWLRSKGPWMPRGRLVDRVLDHYLAHLTAASDPGREPTGTGTGQAVVTERTESRS